MSEFEYAVGDPTSEERGSGARANGGKEELDLIPLHLWSLSYGTSDEHYEVDRMLKILEQLALWQRGEFELKALVEMGYITTTDLAAAIPALEYGKGKYAAWNWAKGMKWSIPVGCLLRHLKKEYFNRGQPDVDSGASHFSHFMANVVMLLHFEEYCPDLNDIKHESLDPSWHEENA